MNTSSKTLVWDLPTRIFHWLLVIVVFMQFASGIVAGEWLTIHSYLGYLTLTLIFFRLFWGIWGGHWSRFKNFVPTPFSLLNYVRGLFNISSLVNTPHEKLPFNPQQLATPNSSVLSASPSHNPLGAVSILLMLLLLLLQVLSGSMSSDDIAFAGPLVNAVGNDTVEWMTWYHSCVGYYLLICLITLHVFAILFYQIKKSNNLTLAMISGYKKLEAPVRASSDTKAKRLLALFLLAVSASFVYILVMYFSN